MVMELDRVKEWEEVKKHARIVAKAWADPEFKERLLANPREVLVAHGFEVPEGTAVSIVEPGEGTLSVIGDAIWFNLPAKPSDGLGDEYLTGTGPNSPEAGSSGGTGPCFSHGPQTSAPFSHGPPCCGACE
jgi:hypothetical protein